MKSILIGNTGLIGRTLLESKNFDYAFNSKNIGEYSKVEDGCELYLSCLPAAKWLVNKDPQSDLETIHILKNIISTKRYSKIVLFSTIDVYCDSPLGSDENYTPNIRNLNYGSNRYMFELFMQHLVHSDVLHIFRLPALYSNNIKKNVLFDLLNNNNVNQININSAYQWYNLEALHKDIVYYPALYPKQRIFNLFPEPVETSELLKFFPEYNLTNHGIRIEYNYKTIHGEYIHNKQQSLQSIERFVHAYRSK